MNRLTAALLLLPSLALAQSTELVWTFPAITMESFDYDAMRVNIDVRPTTNIAPVVGTIYSRATGIGIPLWGSCIKNDAGYYCSASTQRGEIVFQTDATGKAGGLAVAPSSSGKAMTLWSVRPI